MAEKIFLQVLDRSITASFVICFVLLTRLFLKKSPKIFSYALWLVVLIRLICPFSIESAYSLVPKVAQQWSVKERENEVIPYEENNGNFNSKNNSISASGGQNKSGGSVIEEEQGETMSHFNSSESLQLGSFIGMSIWVIGMFALWGYSFIHFLRLKKGLKTALPYEHHIFISDQIDTAFVLGIIQPEIYLPFHLEEAEREYILLHEQTHIRRKDPFIKFISFLVLCVYWFNPFVWIAFFASGKDMEMSCDEAVIQKIGKERKREYSSSLLKLTTKRSIIGGTPIAFGEGDTKKRIKNVLNYKKPTFWAMVLVFLVVFIFGIGLVTNPKAERISLPERARVTGIQMEKVYNGKGEGSVKSISNDIIGSVEGALKTATKEVSSSVNDTPNAEEYLKIEYFGQEKRTFYCYERNNQFYVEEPYTGIYRMNKKGKTTLDFLYELMKSEEQSQQSMTTSSEASEVHLFEQAIHNAIIQSEESRDTEFVVCESHVVLDTEVQTSESNDENMETVIVYALVMREEYDLKNGKIQDFMEQLYSGSGMPIAITFRVGKNGDYILEEYWQPGDGDLYKSDIESKFPKEIVDDALGIEKVAVAQAQNIYQQLIEGGYVDAEAMITKSIDHIIQYQKEKNTPDWLLNAEQRDLTFYGDYMLFYAYERFLNGDVQEEKASIMETACRAILKQTEEDIVSQEKHGQQWFEAYVKKLKSYEKRKGLAYIKENMPKGYLLLTMKSN